VAPIVEQAVQISKPLIDQHAHRLAVSLPDEPIVLDADPTRLAQVIANLLNNAAKYSERGALIAIDAERRGESVVVSVADTGIGIRADVMPRIFDLFVQADHPSDRAAAGLGIGLTLVRRLVEMHGGTVVAHSDGP